jgi:hypothetical protein
MITPKAVALHSHHWHAAVHVRAHGCGHSVAQHAAGAIEKKRRVVQRVSEYVEK